MKKRIEWIDIVKFICIANVVLFHIDYHSNIHIFNDIWKYFLGLGGIFEVTLFYCVAGFTLDNNKLKNSKQFLINKFKKLYVKVITIGIIAVFLHNFFIKINFYDMNILYNGREMFLYNGIDLLKNILITILLANREVILGAMWFVYTLIIAFIILTIMQWVIDHIFKFKNSRIIRLLCCFVLMNVSIFFSSVFHITIPRFSNTLVGVFLIDFTNYIFQEYNITFENKIIFLSSLIIFLTAPFYGSISMNTNKIPNPAFLIIFVYAALYVIAFISKKMAKFKIGPIISKIGKESFSIMAFQFLSFKLGTLLLNIFNIDVNLGSLKPYTNNFLIVIYYLSFGIIVPYLITTIFKNIRKGLCCRKKVYNK